MATSKSFVFWEHLQAAISDLWSRFSTALSGKANSSHTHNIEDVSDLQEQLQALASTQGATETKEVVSVDTYTDLDELQDPSAEVIYITADDNKLYIYKEDDQEFVEVTNEVIDNTIYVSNLDELISRTYTAAGIFTVVHSYVQRIMRGRIAYRVARSDTYTLAVVATRMASGRITPFRYIPYLTSKDGWAEIVTDEEDNEVWKWHKYAYSTIPITYQELVELRDNGALVAGQKYRITDYLTTVDDPDGEVRSAGHPFDLLVTAASERALEAEAVPLHSERDTNGYFDDYNLEACKVWYCLDNDTDKYEWADETNGKGVIYRMIDIDGNDCPYDFKNVQFKRYAISNITSSSLTADALNNLKSTYCYDQNGGKCFATKDVWGNWVPADSNGTSYEVDDETFDWYYTFHGLKSEDGETIDEGYDMSTHPLTLTEECLEYLEDDGCGTDTKDMCHHNVLKPAYWEYFVDDEYYKGRQVLNNIVFINGLSYCYYNDDDDYWEYSTGYCYGNTFGVECKNSTFGNDCYNNTFGNYFQYNTFGNYFQYNTFGNNIRYLTVHSNVMYCNVQGSSGSSYVQNAQILNGTQGTSSSSKLSIQFAANANYTQFAGLNSSNVLKIWTPADAA